MPCIACRVVAADGEWIVQRQSVRLGPYHAQETALRVALAEALALRRRGCRVRVSAENKSGATCAEYCLCENFTHAA
jgi:hypothetical protein